MIKCLTPRHHEIARRLLLGESQRDIAEALSLSEEHVSRIVRSAPFQQHMTELEGKVDFDAVKFFQERLEKACDLITGFLDDPHASASTRLSAARLVLQLGQQKPAGPAPLTFEERLQQAGLL